MINLHYLKRYLKFCASFKDYEKVIGKTECHHIIPRSSGGNNDIINIIHLPIKAHILAHEILAKAIPNKNNLLAFRMMCLMKPNGDSDRKPSLRQIALLREMSARLIVGENHPMYGQQMSDESKAKMSLAKIGKPSPRLGSKMSISAKEKLSNTLKEIYKDPYKHPRVDKTIYHFIHDNGTIYMGTIIGMTHFLYKEDNLVSQKLKLVQKGLRQQHKGWRKLHVNTETA